MKNATKAGYPVLQKGALKEEVWEWADLEASARAGRLSPDSLIFFSEDNTWRKAADTDLASCLSVASPSEPDRELESEYEDALADVNQNPVDHGPLLHAAELAMAIGNKDLAREHYQKALELSPFHPRVAQEAKRNLPPRDLRTLRLLQKPPHVWEEPLRLAAYPAARGPLYILIPMLVVFAMTWSVWTLIPCAFLLGLWGMEVIARSSTGEFRPPHWRSLVVNAGRTHLKRFTSLFGATLELYLPFIAIAALLMIIGQSDRSNPLEVVSKSPVLSVLVFTASLVYLPAVLMLVSANGTRIRDALNPLQIGSAIRLMEGEYIAAVVFILALTCAIWGLGRPLGSILVAPRVLYAASTVYAVLAGGFVLGRLFARFREQLEETTRDSTGS
ncbi:MAG: hypothetical protein JSW50_10185 [Candidatus Latescibacterota bacterium]|nr:MAG: hypothetical protein JSW50_10185 [Candidatus Latescibacterota bacterium]